MTHEQEPRSLKFARDPAFQLELRRRVDAYFRTTGLRERDWLADVREDRHRRCHLRGLVRVAGVRRREDTGRIEHAWAVHQVETTVDFARRSRVVAWLLGGLNFQIEHHLFPRISHVNYPALSRLVEETCRDFGITYAEHPSFRAALASHFRWLRRMGMPSAAG